MNKMISFLKECKKEFKLVIWPTKEEVYLNTKLIIMTTIIFAMVLGFVDFLLINIVSFIF